MQEQRWLWVTLILSCISIAAITFAVWEVAENRFFRHADYVTLHYLYITRGIASSLFLAFWAAWYVISQRRRSEEELRRSRERYRGLLEVSPGAVALYDASLRVSEWNATAERLYGFSKAEVLGKPLPTVPAGKQEELRSFLDRVRAGESLLDIETLRRDKMGTAFEVQLSLLPFREAAAQHLFLEVTEDIRERVRLRERLVELEKLTTMGRMAAGTAHHLNTPLAAMLLRVQMMRERPARDQVAADLERLEAGMGFCKQFVERLLQFSRRPATRKQPEEVGPLIRGVVNFLAPAMEAKRARVTLDPDSASGERVMADRNLLEALLSVLLSNALDAIASQGSISIQCRKSSPECIEIRISDDGPGIAAADLPRVFEPFFTTKGPGGGTGLGLSIAQNIVLEHGGSLRLDSAPNRGTTAVVELPCCQPRPALEQAHP
ncbi:MAG: ATP-binding protein [Bryobacterales bacterium]|nr:ATP-binding protein [Bryobacterales bacterium]